MVISTSSWTPSPDASLAASRPQQLQLGHYDSKSPSQVWVDLVCSVGSLLYLLLTAAAVVCSVWIGCYRPSARFCSCSHSMFERHGVHLPRAPTVLHALNSGRVVARGPGLQAQPDNHCDKWRCGVFKSVSAAVLVCHSRSEYDCPHSGLEGRESWANSATELLTETLILTQSSQSVQSSSFV